MRFSKDYSKLDNDIFTTIRKNARAYTLSAPRKITTPTKQFIARLIEVRLITKSDITERLAQSDADCSRDELIVMLEKWYGKKFDDFVLLTLQKEEAHLVERQRQVDEFSRKRWRAKCSHKATVALNEEGNTGIYCVSCGERISEEV